MIGITSIGMDDSVVFLSGEANLKGERLGLVLVAELFSMPKHFCKASLCSGIGVFRHAKVQAFLGICFFRHMLF